jgi:hypothetical protein
MASPTHPTTTTTTRGQVVIGQVVRGSVGLGNFLQIDPHGRITRTANQKEVKPDIESR